ncbi:ABC transporter permease [Phreatobacter sp. AB_2022a]|uniref:ABC transporter permease n=1 Tax=Phreatobacter sp. AB_2022a TaxID=3003134 RepID=UPI0022875571|nr:ABC transporter permease [Phreatobacter sp. AB_2022a]MCZ0736730.1 ABC transporter permease [Phreatobacter sp. AB_2022a]
MDASHFLMFLAQRLIKALGVVVGVVILAFFLVRLAPGDPALVIAGQSGAADAQFLAQLRQQFGLDRSLGEQLFIYLKGIASLDFGYSHRVQRTVGSLIAERLPATILLTGTAFAFAVTVGVTLGVLAARRVGTWADSLITVIALTCYATPLFWVGLLFILVFSIWLNWLPAIGMYSIGEDLTGLAFALDVARYLILPALTLGLFFMALYARLTRASMLEVATQDFVRTARAKGLKEGPIVRRHILRNALLPVIGFAGVQAGTIVGGSVLVETVFAWPGVGRLAFEALLARDYNLLLGVFIVTSAMAVVINLITDIVYALVDPRIEVGA